MKCNIDDDFTGKKVASISPVLKSASKSAFFETQILSLSAGLFIFYKCTTVRTVLVALLARIPRPYFQTQAQNKPAFLLTMTQTKNPDTSQFVRRTSIYEYMRKTTDTKYY